ncbi:FUSC family protein [Jatrophihabitans endophyticus]|uniref:FUSC family protein n=1 Tax=Jatrophihabitans endophyticus TaxID=1206085 RepID=UPI0019E250E0|nr:FUSC family protein [Jatrophihabitans endophyticus]MBE7188670.1 FUSC family protein [Jatrophihabitans endophyticus]
MTRTRPTAPGAPPSTTEPGPATPEGPRHARGLTDDALVLDPRAPSVRTYLRTAVDRLAGADPGLTQLRTATQAVLGIAAGAGAAYGFVRLTGALQLPSDAGPPALVQASNHALLIVAMLLSGMVAMMAGFTVQDRTLTGQALSTVLLPVPMIAALTIGLALGPYRVPSLIWLVVVLSLAVYVRRWGPRGFAAGLVAFNGAFLGFFLHAEIALGDLGWLAAELGVGALASLVVRVLLFRPDPHGTLERMRRSWAVRADQLVGTALELLDADDESERSRHAQRLQRQLVRLNESTLIVEAQLATTAPRAATTAAQQLFDAELALGNIGRFVNAIARLCPDGLVRTRARVSLSALLREDWDHACSGADALLAGQGATARLTVLSHRLGSSVKQYTEARRRLHALVVDDESGADFVPAVQLANGFLPGSMPVSAAASSTRGRRTFDRAVLPPYLRASIQMAVAATIAVVVGDAVSGLRLYWALLATFLAFMATTNSGEQARKAIFRVTGTAIGIVIGDLLVRVTGGETWVSLIFVLVAPFFGIYLIRTNYMFMVIGITVTMSQLYVQLGEFSWSLLLLRLGETAIGVGAVILTVLFIVPLRPQRVLTAGVLLWFRALSGLVDVSLDRLLGGDPTTSSRQAIRELDAAYDSLEATAIPLRRSTFGRNSAQLTEVRAVATAARSYARSLAVETESIGEPDRSALQHSTELRAAARGLRASIAAIDHRIETGGPGTYVRSSSLVEMATSPLPEGDGPTRFALRDLTLLDGALARLAVALQMDVTDHDTLEHQDTLGHGAPGRRGRVTAPTGDPAAR